MTYERGETVARGKCYACSDVVAVKVNRAGKAYYRCDGCGIEMRHHLMRSSNKMLQGLGVSVAGAPPAAVDEPKKKEGGGWLGQLLEAE